jgi:hypothetical protein
VLINCWQESCEILIGQVTKVHWKFFVNFEMQDLEDIQDLYALYDPYSFMILEMEKITMTLAFQL